MSIVTWMEQKRQLGRCVAAAGPVLAASWQPFA